MTPQEDRLSEQTAATAQLQAAIGEAEADVSGESAATVLLEAALKRAGAARVDAALVSSAEGHLKRLRDAKAGMEKHVLQANEGLRAALGANSMIHLEAAVERAQARQLATGPEPDSEWQWPLLPASLHSTLSLRPDP